MEPRPPQPRTSRPFEPAGSPETAGIGERLYPTPGDPTYYAGPEAYPPGVAAEPPLLPRRQRRQRGVLQGIAVALVAIGALVAVGWFFRDAVRGFVVPPAPTPTVAAQVAAPGTPEPEPETAALPNALATVTPTPASAADASATATSEPTSEEEAAVAQEGAAGAEPDAVEPDRDISSETLPLLDLLPTQAQMPPGLILADEAERSKADVVASLGGTEESSQLLDEWGWSGNAFRDFIADAEAPPPSGTSFVNVSVHRFADAQSANNAMTVFSDYVIFTQGLQNVESPAVGDDAVLLIGAPDGIPLAVLYAQQGPIMYRIGGSSNSAESDPTSEVLAVAAEIIPGQETGG